MIEETKDIALRDPMNQLVTTLPMGEEAENMLKWANMMQETKFYQQMVASGGKYAILAIFGAARELGIPPFLAINGGIWVVQGRVMLSAQMMSMLIRRKGHSVTIKTCNHEMCHLVGKRNDKFGDTAEAMFTIQQAQSIGLTKNPVWKNYPDTMLYNRALSILAKRLFADAIGNAMVEGEMDFVEILPEEPKQMDKESALFIDRFGLLDLNCIASKFIDSISINTGQSRTLTISQCAKEPEKFEINLERFIKKTQPSPAIVKEK